MLNISEFLKRAGGMIVKEARTRGVIQTIIKKHVGVDVPIESIVIKPPTVILSNIPQALRSAIFIKQQVILEAVNAAGIAKTPFISIR